MGGAFSTCYCSVCDPASPLTWVDGSFFWPFGVRCDYPSFCLYLNRDPIVGERTAPVKDNSLSPLTFPVYI